ncbi:MAG TPA: c-type cytochrome, partial [Agriterribacter sp.]|nr:c-type cytochrome [Agriterribacter sp.]
AQGIADRLMTFLPDSDERVNVELVRLLIYLKDTHVIATALDLIRSSKTPPPPEWGTLIQRNNSYGGTIQRMLDDPPPVNQLEYLFMLRDMKEGWTIEQRKTYFSLINAAADAMGGESYWGFLERMRNEALLGIPDEDRIALGDIISKPIAKAPPFEIKPVKGPGKNWTVNSALQAVNAPSGMKNFEQGRNAFFAIGCASCHRFDGMGGNVGPDLGSVGNRFSVQKILEDIIDPSATVSDLYGSSRVTLNSGRSLEGLVVKDEAFIKVYSRDPDRAPDIISASEVASIEPVPVSQMPPGLINVLNADELRSLIAYLRSGGDPKHEAFR